MANRFAVATGNWSATSVWSTTSGGSPGASVPTAADSAIFDAASGAVTVTLDAAAGTCLDLNMMGVGGASAFTGTLTGGAGTLLIVGNVTLSTGGTYGISQVQLNATTSGKTITSNGKILAAGTILFNGTTSAAYTMQDNLSCSALGFINGSLTTSNHSLSVASNIFTSGGGVYALVLGSSSVSCGIWDVGFAGGSFTCGTSTITVAGLIFNGANLTYATVVLSNSSGGVVAMTGANTFATLTLSTVGAYESLILSSSITVSGTFTCIGNNASTQRRYVGSAAQGTPVTITAAVVSLTNVDFEDITGAGAATWSGTSIGDCGGNTGITVATPINVFWVHGATASHAITDAQWFTTSGGSTPARFPLPQDVGTWDLNSFPATGKTVTIGMAGLRLSTMFLQTATHAPTFSWDQYFNIYGSLLLTGVTVVAGTSQAYFKGRLLGGGFTLTSAGNSFYDLVFSAPGAFLTLQDALVCTHFMYLEHGTFSANNFNVTTGAVADGGSLTRTVTMGSGIWTLTGQDTIWDLSPTGLTLNTTLGSVIAITGSGGANRIFQGRGLTFNNDVAITSSVVGWPFVFRDSNTTFRGTLTVTTPDNAIVYPFSDSAHTGISWANIVFDQTTVCVINIVGIGTIIGNLTLSVGCVMGTGIDAAALIFTGSSAITSNGVVLHSALEFNDGAAGKTFTLIDAFNTSSSITLTAGTFDTASQALTMSAFDSHVANVRSLILRMSYVTLTGTGATVWNISTATNMTLLCGVSTIQINGATGTEVFAGGALIYYNLLFHGINTSSGVLQITDGNTYNTITMDFVGTIQFGNGTTTHVTGFYVAGNATSLAGLQVITAGTWFIVMIGTGLVTIPYATINNGHFSVNVPVGYIAPGHTWYAINSSDGGGNSGIVFGAPDSSLVMPRIFFNSRQIDFTKQNYTIQDDPSHSALRNVSASGIVENLNISASDSIQFAFRNFFNANIPDADIKRRLKQWLHWAQMGLPWSIALDPAELVLTKLAAPAAVGDKTITVSNRIGISVGKNYVIRSLDKIDLVQVTAVASSLVSFADPLDFAYDTGDRFRSELYWPGRLVDNTNPVIDAPQINYDVNMAFMEDVNDLVTA